MITTTRARWQDLLTRIDTTFPALQDHSAVVSWKTELKAPLEEISRGVRSRRCSRRRTRCMQMCAWPCSLRCTCMPATATCTPTCPSIPTITRCCRRRARRGADHGARAVAETA